MFDFRLKVFYTVALRHSFTKAAQELFITQPAVTKHIHELEKQLHQTLIERNGKHLELTAAGNLLFSYSKRIFALYDELEFEMAQLEGKAAGELRLGASTTIAQYILPRALAAFAKQHAAIRLSVIDGNTDFIEQQLQENKLDLGLIEGHSRKSFLHYIPFTDDELVLVTATANHAFKKTEISLDQLAGLPLVVREHGSGTLEILQHALQQQGISPEQLNIVLRLSTSEGIKQYLLHSNSFAFLSIHAVMQEILQQQLRVVELKELRINRTLQFVHLQGQPSPQAALFMRFCKALYKLK